MGLSIFPVKRSPYSKMRRKPSEELSTISKSCKNCSSKVLAQSPTLIGTIWIRFLVDRMPLFIALFYVIFIKTYLWCQKWRLEWDFIRQIIATRVESKKCDFQEFLDVIFRYIITARSIIHSTVPRRNEKPQTRSVLDASGSRHFSAQYDICGVWLNSENIFQVVS